MDERRQTSTLAERREASSALPFAEQREQIRRFLGELSESTSAAEAEIAGVVKELLDDLQTAQCQRGDDADRSAELAAQMARLEERRRELDELGLSLERRRAEYDDSSRRLQTQQRELQDDRRQLDRERDDLSAARSRLDEKLRRLEARSEELETEQTRTKNQRRRLAAELVEQRETNRREFARRTAELDDRRAELERRGHELDRRIAELERNAAELADAQTADESLRDEAERLRDALARRSAELDRAESQLDEANRRLQAAEENETTQEAIELRRRLAEAQEDLRDLRIRNASLEKAHGAPAACDAAPQAMDWESQKRRLLAALDADFDARNPAARADRLTIEGAINITDGIVAAKEREIEELKRRLETGACDLGSSTVDDFVESRSDWPDDCRARIEELERTLKEKLRNAEIEISVERAKLARDRTELNEERAEFEARRSQTDDASQASSPAVAETKKPAGGRWLARLGLGDRNA